MPISPPFVVVRLTDVGILAAGGPRGAVRMRQTALVHSSAVNGAVGDPGEPKTRRRSGVGLEQTPQIRSKWG
jgi:hypothetical protein